MFPYHRLQEILTYLYQKKEPVALSELTGAFQVSERTLRSDIQTINAIIIQHGAYIERIRKKGFYIEISEPANFQAFIQTCETTTSVDELDNAQKRIHYLLQTLLFKDTYTSQEELLDTLYISRNTLSNYTKTIRIMIEQYDLQLIQKVNLGLRILGREEDKRSCFMELIIPHDIQSMVMEFSPEIKQIFKGIDLYKIEHIVLQYAKEHDVRFSDFNLRNLILHFALLITRLQMKCPLTLDIQKEDTEYNIEPLLKEMELAFNLEIPKSERHYLYSHFMSNAKTMYKFEENKRYLQAVVERLLESIYHTYNFELRHDALLTHDLIQHFQSILNTKRYHLNKRNPLLNTIKTNYPLAFDITLTCMQEILEQEPYQLTEDEIGYVSLHIGAAIERCFSAQITKKSVLIVCGSGYATSRMLEAKLNNLFHDKINIIGRCSYNEYQQMHLEHADFVVSTIPIETKDIPVITVDFSLTVQDIENVTKALTTTTQITNTSIDEFFDSDLFFYYDKPKDKQEVLHTLCESMRKKGIVYDDYEASVLKREAIAATNMDDILAIPHPMNLCAMKTCVSVAIMQEPLQWNDKASVRIILLLAINKDEHNNIEHLYETFIQIMNHSQMQSLVLKCHTFSTFMNILHTFQNDMD